MQSISCISLQRWLHFGACLIQVPALFFGYFIKLSLSLMSAPASSTLHTNYILSSIWCSTFLAVSHFFNVSAAFIRVSLATIFYAPCPIFCWASISFLLCLSNILFFSFGISLRLPMVFCAASLIILISFLIEAYFCIYVINLGHCLTLRASFCVSLFITVFVTRLILWRLCFSELHFFL